MKIYLDIVMTKFIAQIIAKIKALELWCIIHGPKIWVAIVTICCVSFILVLGMWLAALLGANGRDDDDR